MLTENEIAREVLAKLRRQGQTLAFAESCTGGLVSSMVTKIAGASDVFLGSVVSYANAIKENVLGVSADIIQTHGAVSAECASAMALGVQKLTGATCVAAVTGIAGPGGGTLQKPVGTVFISWIMPAGQKTEQLLIPGDREAFQQQTAFAVLNGF